MTEVKVRDIPSRTRTEEAQKEKEDLKGLFEGDDLSGLTVNTRRSRRISSQDIDEYLKTLTFNDESQGRGSEEVEEEPMLGGSFKPRYRMRLISEEDELDIPSPAKPTSRTGSEPFSRVSDSLEKRKRKRSQSNLVIDEILLSLEEGTHSLWLLTKSKIYCSAKDRRHNIALNLSLIQPFDACPTESQLEVEGHSTRIPSNSHDFSIFCELSAYETPLDITFQLCWFKKFCPIQLQRKTGNKALSPPTKHAIFAEKKFLVVLETSLTNEDELLYDLNSVVCFQQKLNEFDYDYYDNSEKDNWFAGFIKQIDQIRACSLHDMVLLIHEGLSKHSQVKSSSVLTSNVQEDQLSDMNDLEYSLKKPTRKSSSDEFKEDLLKGTKKDTGEVSFSY